MKRIRLLLFALTTLLPISSVYGKSLTDLPNSYTCYSEEVILEYLKKWEIEFPWVRTIEENGITYNITWMAFGYRAVVDGYGSAEIPDLTPHYIRNENNNYVMDYEGIAYVNQIAANNIRRHYESPIKGEATMIKKKEGSYSGKINIPENIIVSFDWSVIEGPVVVSVNGNDIYGIFMGKYYGNGGNNGYIPVSGTFTVTDIDKNAFYGNSGVTSVSLPNTTETTPTFENCKNLLSVKLSQKAKNSGKYIGCSSLQMIDMTSSLEEIDDNAFWNCTNLEKAYLPQNLKKIGVGAFGNCTSLKILDKNFADKIVLPSSLEEIGGGAFYNCTSLEKINIPDNVTQIGTSIFENCTGLKSASLGKGITEIPEKMFYGCTKLSSIVIPDQIKTIGNYAFYGCENLQSTVFTDNIHNPNPQLTEIGYQAFYGCKSLTRIKLYKPLKKIGNIAFVGCTALKVIILPSTLEYIDYFAFSDCEALEKIYAYMPVPFEISSSTFPNSVYKWATLYVPEDYKKDYCNTFAWNKFSLINKIGATGGGSEMMTIMAKDYSRTYGDANPEFEYDAEGLEVEGTPVITCEAMATSPVGTYPIIISKGSVTNNSVTYVDGTLTITKAPLTIKVSNNTKEEGEANPTFTLTYEGFKNNETQAVLTKQPKVSCSAQQDSPVGSYTVTVSGAEAQNYEISYVNGTLTVKEKEDISGLVNGDVFTAQTVEGVTMLFRVISITDKTCQVGVGNQAAIDKNTTGGITIPSKVKGLRVTRISGSSFINCPNLTSLVIPEGVETLESNSISKCNSITSFVLPASVTCLSNTFGGVSKNLLSLSVAPGNPIYDSRGNCNAIIESATNTLVRGCATSVIPNTITAVGAWSFSGGELESIEIPNKVASIGEFAFQDNNFKEIIIPASVSEIGWSAFTKCNKLEKITIFSRDCKIGSGAFSKNSSLKEVISFINKPQTANSAIFYTEVVDGKEIVNDNVKLYVPNGTKSLYENTEGWKEFKNIIEMRPFVLGDANNDGDVNEKDRNYIVRHIMGDTPDDFDKEAADMNDDKKVNVADIVELNSLLDTK